VPFPFSRADFVSVCRSDFFCRSPFLLPISFRLADLVLPRRSRLCGVLRFRVLHADLRSLTSSPGVENPLTST
jgi:hypothetical protein